MKKTLLTISLAVILSNLTPFQYALLKADLTTKVSKGQIQIMTNNEKINWVGMVIDLNKQCNGLRFKNINFKDIFLRLNNLLINNKCSE